MEYLDIKVTKKILPPINVFDLSSLNKSSNYIVDKQNIDDIRTRVNNLMFRKKGELIYFCLVLYKYFLDEEEDIPGEELFRFSFYTDIERIVVYSENKISSFHMPFKATIDEFGTRILESRINVGEQISRNDLIFLIDYFKYSIFLSFESDSFFEQLTTIEAIKVGFTSQAMGFQTLDEDKLSKLVSELLFYDSSYLRYDIDLEHSLKEGKFFDRERVFQHPPYHIDSDYRDAPSYKIAFDRKISDVEFLNIFQMDKSAYSMIIKDGYKPERLIGDVQKYHISLNQKS